MRWLPERVLSKPAAPRVRNPTRRRVVANAFVEPWHRRLVSAERPQASARALAGRVGAAARGFAGSSMMSGPDRRRSKSKDDQAAPNTGDDTGTGSVPPA